MDLTAEHVVQRCNTSVAAINDHHSQESNATGWLTVAPVLGTMV